jgi:hypothetical protein
MLITKGMQLQVSATLTNIGAEGGAPVAAIVTGLWFGNKDTASGEVRANITAFPAGVAPVPLLNFRVYDTRTGDGVGGADADFNGYAFITDDTLEQKPIVNPGLKHVAGAHA